jgi:hypothetical protein
MTGSENWLKSTKAISFIQIYFDGTGSHLIYTSHGRQLIDLLIES